MDFPRILRDGQFNDFLSWLATRCSKIKRPLGDGRFITGR